MTIKLSSIRANSALEREGDWVESIAFPGVSFKLRSINFPAYALARDLMVQRLRRKYGSKPIPQEVSTPGIGRLYAEHLLLDWKGLDEPYSKELALQTLTDPEFRDLVSAIELAAGVVGEAEVEFVEEASKNYEPSSATG